MWEIFSCRFLPPKEEMKVNDEVNNAFTVYNACSAYFT